MAFGPATFASLKSDSGLTNTSMDEPLMTELETLKRENEELRAELVRRDKAAEKETLRKKRIIKSAGRFILPIADRRRVVRNFIDLLETSLRYTAPAPEHPEKDEVIAKFKLFALSVMRFIIRRRVFFLIFSLIVFAVPLVQVWLVFQQNEIIQNQNKYFKIEVYDMVARTLTSTDSTAKQITSALLAKEDFDLLNGIIGAVFRQESGGVFTKEALSGGHPFLLKESAARGYLLSAFVQAIDRNLGRESLGSIAKKIDRSIALIIRDAETRLATLLRIEEPVAAHGGNKTDQESYRYIFNLGTVLRRQWLIANSIDEKEKFFSLVAPLIRRLGHIRLKPDARLPFVKVFASAFHEFLVDLELEPTIEKKDHRLDDSEALIRKGFAKLKKGIGATTVARKRKINWSYLEQLFEIP